MKRTAVCLIALIISTLVAISAAAEKIYDVSEVKVIRTGAGIMYSYHDESGQLIVQDVPPPGYLESLTALQAQQEVVSDNTEETPVAMPVVQDEPIAWVRPALALLSVLLLFAAAYVFFTPLYRRWRGESRLQRVLRRAGWPLMVNVDLSVDGHPPTRIDCLARTPAGVLVLSDIRVTGEISGRPNDDFWLQKTHNDRLQIDNPLQKNARNTRIVGALLRGVPIHSRIVYTGHAEFPPGTPASLQKLSEFAENLNLFETEAPDQRSLAGGWRTLMVYPHANRVIPRPMGTGWKRWLRYHWRAVASGSLLTISVSIMLVLLTMHWLATG